MKNLFRMRILNDLDGLVTNLQYMEFSAQLKIAPTALDEIVVRLQL
jgi:hypothetical protein